MKLLYVDRHPKTRSKQFWARHLKRISDSYKLNNRDGFFLASLKTRADVKIISLEKLAQMNERHLSQFDAVIYHHLCSFTTRRPGFEFLDKAIRSLPDRVKKIPGILLLATANAYDMPSDETLDLFDLVFKREPYKDLDRYNLTSVNREKIRSTVLSCHLVPATIYNYKRIQPVEYGEKSVSEIYKHDLFFTGMDTSPKRREMVRQLRESSLNFVGGLQKDSDPLPEEIRFKRLSKQDFYKTICESRINLALEGYGQFTYRHWELWCLSSFMISSPSIREVQLPFEFNEEEHFVVFENYDDLMDKITYFLDHESERVKIAQNGRALFESEYDFHKHGATLYSALADVIS